jgi:predicted secreted acid phosphatase
MRSRALVVGFFAGALTVLGGVAVAAELSTDNIRETSVSDGTPIEGLRPTGVGLPEVGVESTTGTGDYPEAVRAYHDSGQYEADLNAVGRKAEKYLVKRSQKLRDKAKKKCKKKPCKKPKLAVVFDIDETSLSNYEELDAGNFADASGALVMAVFAGDSPAIAATHRIYETALDEGVAVFFITGRPEAPEIRTLTENNLASAGYETYEELILNDTGEHTIEYKSGKRAEIEDRGFDIVTNVGDQESDLAGGGADRAFKLPNPYYFIP